MNLIQIKAQYLTTLEAIYDIHEIESIFDLASEEIMQLDRSKIRSIRNEQVDPFVQTKLLDILKELKTHKPIQYILEKAWFCGFPFKVTEAVLIPRPETEELIHWILQTISNKNFNPQMLDIGTGSGCIPILLKLKLPHAEITSIDISDTAIQVAKENAAIHNTSIQFEIKDILQIAQLDKKYDLIVSNPPYIPLAEKKNMSANVLEYEPHLALFVPNEDPLRFYKKIAQLALDSLNKDGLLFFEIHFDQAIAIEQLLTSLHFDVETRKDIYGNHRMIKATKKN